MAERMPEVLVAVNGSLAVWRSIQFLRSPAFIVLTKSAHLALARIEIEIAIGRHCVTHRSFQSYGIKRDCISHAIAELEGLGIIVVQRHDAKANSFGISDKWREIATIEDARRIRDKARDFGIYRKKKRERAMARLKRQNHQTEIEREEHADDDHDHNDAGPAALVGDDDKSGIRRLAPVNAQGAGADRNRSGAHRHRCDLP